MANRVWELKHWFETNTRTILWFPFSICTKRCPLSGWESLFHCFEYFIIRCRKEQEEEYLSMGKCALASLYPQTSKLKPMGHNRTQSLTNFAVVTAVAGHTRARVLLKQCRILNTCATVLTQWRYVARFLYCNWNAIGFAEDRTQRRKSKKWGILRVWIIEQTWPHTTYFHLTIDH